MPRTRIRRPWSRRGKPSRQVPPETSHDHCRQGNLSVPGVFSRHINPPLGLGLRLHNKLGLRLYSTLILGLYITLKSRLGLYTTLLLGLGLHITLKLGLHTVPYMEGQRSYGTVRDEGECVRDEGEFVWYGMG